MSIAKRIDWPDAKNYKLDKMIQAIESSGHPERGRNSIIVAGTNGKGSVAWFLAQMLEAAGKRVGSYFSPHVYERRERIRLGREKIEEAELESLEQEFSEILEPLTYFERMTMLAFLSFRKHEMDYQVLEVGMGGRLDATNVCDAELAVLTSIGRDHEEILGPGLLNIAREKCGVIKKASKVVSFLPETDELRALIEEEAERKKAKLYFVDAIMPELNRALAEKAYQLLREQDPSLPGLGKSFSPQTLPARQQVLRLEPPLIVDGAHNEAAAALLSQFLEREFPGLKFCAYFGMMRDKDLESILGPLKDKIDRLILPSFFPERELAPTVLKQRIEANPEFSKIDVQLYEGSFSAKKPTLVFGSFYLPSALGLERYENEV